MSYKKCYKVSNKKCYEVSYKRYYKVSPKYKKPCKLPNCGLAKIYATNDFLPQFFDQNTPIPAKVNLNSAKNACKIDLNPSTDTITIKENGLYQMQFSVQVFKAAGNNPPSPNVTFELIKDGGVIIDSKTTFTAGSFNTQYVTSTLLLQQLKKGEEISLVLSAPTPISDLVLRIDFASITITQIK